MKSRAVLLVGSPHATGTSAMLGMQILARLTPERWETRTLRVYPAFRSADAWRELSAAVRDADLVVLSAPLYVDALPAAVTQALERLAIELAASGDHAGRRLAAVMNCGFPEARQNDVALRICRRFAREAGLGWAGGLGVSGSSRMGPNLPAALDLTGAALDEGGTVPPEAVALMDKPTVPAWLYALVGSASMWLEARRHGVHWRIGARPYALPRSR